MSGLRVFTTVAGLVTAAVLALSSTAAAAEVCPCNFNGTLVKTTFKCYKFLPKDKPFGQVCKRTYVYTYTYRDAYGNECELDVRNAFFTPGYCTPESTCNGINDACTPVDDDERDDDGGPILRQ